jgi:hypothetical protein
MNTELLPLEVIVKTLKHIEEFIEGTDLKTLEGAEMLEVLCTMYAEAYMLKLRAMK